ncbi:type II secretion system protein, partial [Candidatus Azambacteria bacterium]|nr:type II secretion system protein [Candidatus Azambacteria bacterium]
MATNSSPARSQTESRSKSIAIGNKQQSSEVADRVAASRFTLHEKGFTLLESLVAIAVFTVGVSAAIVLIISSLNVGTRTQHKIIAANLAQEGIEATRNIRDRNWLSGKPWTDAIADTTSPYTLTGCIQWDGNAIDATCALGTRLVFDGSHYAHDP